MFSRTALMLGDEAIKKLNSMHVAVFGLGGVGSYVVEGLVRGGIGKLTLIDSDVYKESNLNRQLFATVSNLGKLKTEVAKVRVKEINPNCEVNVIERFVLPGRIDDVDFSLFDYVVDAIDTVSGKLEIIKKCKENQVLIISSMGTGNKLNPTEFKVSDIKSTKVCPLCKVMRKLLKENGIESLKVVYSEEEPVKATKLLLSDENGKPIPASISFVPSVAGLIIAGEVIKDLLK
ncbi:MAG: tRNA threonylcarbamoyladenosine dehydratase [Clostridia bacterium]|nr:tRNA threonylcarbamoyladenosine dehydratase [Clostridia bacterium]